MIGKLFRGCFEQWQFVGARSGKLDVADANQHARNAVDE